MTYHFAATRGSNNVGRVLERRVTPSWQQRVG